MASFINNLFGKREKTHLESLEPHDERYRYEFNSIPSFSAYGCLPSLFSEEDEDKAFQSIPWDLDSEGALLVQSQTKVKSYRVKEGQIEVFTFPDPVASPEVKYGISVFDDQRRGHLKDPYDYFNLLPYYIMFKIVDVWAIGQVKPFLPEKPNEYITTIYELVESPDLLQFVDWVMKMENLTPIEYKDNCPDLVEKHLRSKNISR